MDADDDTDVMLAAEGLRLAVVVAGRGGVDWRAIGSSLVADQLWFGPPWLKEVNRSRLDLAARWSWVDGAWPRWRVLRRWGRVGLAGDRTALIVKTGSGC